MKYLYKGKEITPLVEISHEIIPHLAGINLKDFYMDGEKCANAWEKGLEIMDDFFGDYNRTVAAVGAPPISYCHLASVGAPIGWPEDSEPNVKPFAKDIEEAISILKEAQGRAFDDNDLARHYIAMNKYLQERFPEKKVYPLTGYGSSGVITTAVLMRGQDFLLDIYDEPEKVHEYLDMLTQSIIAFRKWSNRTNGVPETSAGVYIFDDFAALIPPNMFAEYVIPYWNKVYEELMEGENGYRFLHCEDMYPEHLKYLKDLKLNHFQPSVSNRLTLENIPANTDVPFDWMLYAWRVTDMSDQQIREWVDKTLEAGVTTIRTQIGKYCWSIGRQDRIMAFYKAFEKYRVE